MRKYLLFLFALMGCTTNRDYVALSNEVLPKTVMVYVTSVAEVTQLTFGEDGFKVTTSTQMITVMGAGVFISRNGHVLSANHLFDNGELKSIHVVTYDGVSSSGTLLSTLPSRDLALVRVSSFTNRPFAVLADTREVKVGQEVLAVGNPEGLDFSVSRGIISKLNRDLGVGYNLIQTDTAINPGNSGGPLFDMNGHLVGIVNLKVTDSDGLAFAVETGQVLEFLTRFRGIDTGIPSYKDFWKVLTSGRTVTQ